MSEKINKKQTKSELVKILTKSTSTTREKNKAIKLLKKFPSSQNDELDKHLDRLKFSVKRNGLFFFM